ncbi:hypothetical protein D7X94_17990 [Acutalibacter sp. 1XD8-33]|nr:hypothetical protein D7X94_17990 [Acutalibacter sp. 1XD8-33]
MTFPLKDGGCYPVSTEQCRRWAELYPAVDVEQQLRNMRGWLEANPQKRKTRAGILRFANGWLAREQNQVGQSRLSPTGSQTPDYGREEDYW